MNGDNWQVITGDCLDVMRGMDANSVDTIITDPPYGYSFMSAAWDHGIPGVPFWQAALHAAKPGAMLLAFGGTRTFHRLAVAIEDAGWEIRDTVMWVYGSGFPKSHDISKAIDRANGRVFDDRYELGRHIRERREALGVSRVEVNSWFGYSDGCEHWERQDKHGARVPTLADWPTLRDRLQLSDRWTPLIERIEAEREVIGRKNGNLLAVAPGQNNDRSATALNITAPATPAAQEWDGYGTALKPAWEPIIVAMKPLDGTFAANALEWGVAGLWIDGGRVPTSTEDAAKMERCNTPGSGRFGTGTRGNIYGGGNGTTPPNTKLDTASGRWPANVIHDGSAEVLAGFPVTTTNPGTYRRSTEDAKNTHVVYGKYNEMPPGHTVSTGDTGSAARFFYCAKASRAERNAGLPEGITNIHPTVKSLAIMRYLCRLTKTPTGGIVLDPFAGSGSTGCAAVMEGRRFIGIELSDEYAEIARARIAHAEKQAPVAEQGSLL